MEKIENTQKEIGNMSGERKTLRLNQKEGLETKSTVTEMKNIFNGLVQRLYMAKERTSELEEMTVESPKTEIQRKKGQKR